MTQTNELGSDEHLKDDPYWGYDKVKLTQLMNEQQFFHDMQLDDFRTHTWVYSGEQQPNYHLAPTLNYLKSLNIENLKCLDIGTFDGMTAFVMNALGAARVDATCQYDLPRFRLVRSFLKAKNVQYFPKVDIDEISSSDRFDSYDCIIMSAMLHHLVSPLEALLIARKKLKHHGFLILEVAVATENSLSMELNTIRANPVFGAPTIWVPSRDAIRGMLELSYFNIISETHLLGGRRARETNHDRITLLAEAVDADELVATEKTQEVLNRSIQIGTHYRGQFNSEKSIAKYTGPGGRITFNIWTDDLDVPLQPNWKTTVSEEETGARIGRVRDLQQCLKAVPDGLICLEDIYLLGAKYPGEHMPEGMQWGLKQLGLIYILRHILDWGLESVIEMGAGFNFYLPNRLKNKCDYTALDAASFYDDSLMALARAQLPWGDAQEGLLGQLPADQSLGPFDACVSASVLEHVPDSEIPKVCADMARITKPGGWAVHSLDVPLADVTRAAGLWIKELRSNGYALVNVDLPSDKTELFDPNDAPLLEPLSIKARFYDAQPHKPWQEKPEELNSSAMATVLICAQKQTD